jgi:hypothetical protein
MNIRNTSQSVTKKLIEVLLKKQKCRPNLQAFVRNFVWNISNSKKNSARYYHKCTQVFRWNTRYSCHNLITTEFSRQVFKKYEFNENLSSGSWIVPCGERTDGRTDRQTDMTKLIVFAILRTHWKQTASAPFYILLPSSDYVYATIDQKHHNRNVWQYI